MSFFNKQLKKSVFTRIYLFVSMLTCFFTCLVVSQTPIQEQLIIQGCVQRSTTIQITLAGNLYAVIVDWYRDTSISSVCGEENGMTEKSSFIQYKSTIHVDAFPFVKSFLLLVLFYNNIIWEFHSNINFKTVFFLFF